MERFFDSLGPFVILFALSVLFRFWASITKEKRLGLSRFWAVLWVISSTLAFPVTLFAKWYSKLDEDIYRQDMAENSRKAWEINNRTRKELEDEVESLKALLQEERLRDPEIEFKKGFRNGYIPGYRKGFSDGLSHSQLSLDEKEKLELDAKDRAPSLSSKYVKEHLP